MAAYRIEQRIVSVSVLSLRGWITGQIYLGKINLFLDAVNAMPSFLKLANVAFQDGHTLGFLALQRNATQIIIPHESREMIARKNPLETETKRVGCLLPSGSIEGELYLPPNIRVSDYMVKRKNYFVLHNTSGEIWHDGTETQPGIFNESPAALVNAETLVGVTELV